MKPMSYKTLYEKYRNDSVRLKSLQYSKWTLPKLMADVNEFFNNTPEVLERDYQEVGPLLVNSLSTKLAGLLFPVNRPFFKGKLSDEVIKKAINQGVKEQDLNGSLAQAEMDACELLFLNASYNQLVLMLQHLIVTGNALLYRDSKNQRTVVYGLQQFALIRDGQGVQLDVVLAERQYYGALDGDIQNQLRLNPALNGKNYEFDSVVEMYTRIKRVPTADDSGWQYEVSQQIDNTDVGEKGTYPDHLCPWRAIAWSLIPGEHYGRGLVEDYAGGFAKLSDESQAAALYALEMLRVVNLVAPGTGADIDSLQAAETGEYVQGTPGDIAAHESGSADKLKQVEAGIELTVARLARAFMYQANTRNAERVTAFELRQQAQEAEQTLGGAYSVLSEQIQVPLAHILLREAKPTLLAGLLTGSLKLSVIAGIPALGRAAESQALVSVSQEAVAVMQVLPQVDDRIDKHKLMDTMYRGHSINTSSIFLSEEQQIEVQSANAEIANAQAQQTGVAAMADQLSALQSLEQG